MEANKLLTTGKGQQILDETKVDNYLLVLSYSIKEFFYWWYIKMPLWHLRMLRRISILADDNLSMTLLMKNFFIPWHRDTSLIGYVFGLIIKMIYLPLAILVYLLATAIYLGIVAIWLLLPLATVFFIIRSLF
jgi:hypothetical protein